MNKTSLLILPLSILCLLSCNNDKGKEEERSLTKEEAKEIVNNYSTDDKNVVKIDCSWENKSDESSRQAIQLSLKEAFGATDDLVSETSVTNASDITRIKGKDVIKFNLNKNTFDTYFPDTDSYSFKIKDNCITVTYVNDLSNSYWIYDSNGYLTKVYKHEEILEAEVSINYTVTDVFYY